MAQNDKAIAFSDLHQPENPLVLYNIWDAGGAKALEKAGARAVATGSWSVADAQGYPDGENIPLDFLLQIAERIASSVEIPFTLDFEGGYAGSADELANNIRAVIKCGAIGINFEDQYVGGDGIRDIADQAERIKTIRETANETDVALFINARTDLFLKAAPEDHKTHVSEAIDRAAAYKEAGASGFFVPGLAAPDLISAVCDAVDLPVNVMVRDMKTVQDLATCGIARASFGPNPYRRALKDLVKAYQGD